MILIELKAAIDAAGNVQTFYISNGRFVTKATDTPAHTAFDPCIEDPGSIEVLAFGDGVTTGRTELNVGEIEIKNLDGRFDEWRTYGFEGRSVVIRSGTNGAYPADFPIIFTGTVKDLYADRGRLLIRLVDKQHIFETPLLTTRFAGTNVGPTGIEGTAADIKGSVKPRVYGEVFNISPPCVNTSMLVYQVSDGAIEDIPAVYDKGKAIVQGADFADLATLNAASLTAGTYGTCLAEGLFRLESDPVGLITCDVIEGATEADRTVAQILRRIAIDANLTEGEIDDAALTICDGRNSAPVGIYVDDERSRREAMDELALSIGAFYGFDVEGNFTAMVWEEPNSISLATIKEYYAKDDYESRPARDNPVPVWSVKVNYAKFNTVQTSDLAGVVDVSVERKTRLSKQYLPAVAEDETIKLQHLLAGTLEVNSLLTTEADALAEAARQLAIHDERRDTIEGLSIPLALVSSAGLRVGACVTVQISRFGLAGGKLMRIQGLRLELRSGRALLRVWG